MTMHIGEAKVAPLIAVGQPSMIDPQQVENRGIEIMNMDRSRGQVIFAGAPISRGSSGFPSPSVMLYPKSSV